MLINEKAYTLLTPRDCGVEEEIPEEQETLEGNASLTLPSGTESGQRLRLRGKGLGQGKGLEPGDLIVLISIVVPKKLSPRERELFEELARTSGFKPR